MEYFKIVKDGEKITVTELKEFKGLSEKDMDCLGKSVRKIHRFSEISGDYAYGYANPEQSESFNGWLHNAHLNDGVYIATFDYEYHTNGWPSKNNWYGGDLYSMKEEEPMQHFIFRAMGCYQMTQLIVPAHTKEEALEKGKKWMVDEHFFDDIMDCMTFKITEIKNDGVTVVDYATSLSTD